MRRGFQVLSVYKGARSAAGGGFGVSGDGGDQDDVATVSGQQRLRAQPRFAPLNIWSQSSLAVSKIHRIRMRR